MIEGRDAVSGYEQQRVLDGVEIANFAATEKRQFAEVCCEERSQRKAFRDRTESSILWCAEWFVNAAGDGG